MNIRTKVILVLALCQALATVAMAADAPSRPAEKGCTWVRFSDANMGLAGWYQKCDYGFRKVDCFIKGKTLFLRYSDGGAPEALIESIDLHPGETEEAGLKRIFAERTDKKIVARCELQPYKDAAPIAGAKLYEFGPNAVYAKQYNKENPGDDIPPPPCGDWGSNPDSSQYFETQPASGSRHVLFVWAGQDTPLFDEQTLRLLPSGTPAPK